MRTPQLPRLMSRAKETLHPSLKMRSLHFHTQTWQSWMTWSTGIFTLFSHGVDYLCKYLHSGIGILASLFHWISWNASFYWIRVVKRRMLRLEFCFYFNWVLIKTFKNVYSYPILKALQRGKDFGFLRSTIEIQGGFVLFSNIGLDGLFLYCRKGNWKFF